MVGALEAAPLAGESGRIIQPRIIVNEVTVTIKAVIVDISVRIVVSSILRIMLIGLLGFACVSSIVIPKP